MDHVAILKPSWHLLEKILDGRKTIESRWYVSRYPPWNRINAGDTVYFKNAGCPVSLKANVQKVLQFSDLTPEKIRDLYTVHGKEIGAENIDSSIARNAHKKYCILVFLELAVAVEPFQINKKGFGISAAWLVVKNIDSIKIR